MNKKNFKVLAIFMVMILFIGVLAGCAKKAPEVVDAPKPSVDVNEPGVEDDVKLHVVDDFGVEVTLDKEPVRIISLAPSNTEILFALGLADRIVGVTSYCDYPAEALDVEKIGDYSGINLEKIIELGPDLVINYGSGDPDENARLKEAGITVIGFEPESIDAVIDTINKIGNVTGTSKEAIKLTDSMNEKKEEIISKATSVEKVKVFYEVWHEPLMTVGPGSFMDHLMTLAGGDNIAKDAEDAYPLFDLEQLVERNPQVYLTANDLPEKTAETIIARPGFENIDAIKLGEVYLLDGNIVSRPGPRIVEALELVAKAIHPEIFK